MVSVDVYFPLVIIGGFIVLVFVIGNRLLTHREKMAEKGNKGDINAATRQAYLEGRLAGTEQQQSSVAKSSLQLEAQEEQYEEFMIKEDLSKGEIAKALGIRMREIRNNGLSVMDPQYRTSPILPVVAGFFRKMEFILEDEVNKAKVLLNFDERRKKLDEFELKLDKYESSIEKYEDRLEGMEYYGEKLDVKNAGRNTRKYINKIISNERKIAGLIKKNESLSQKEYPVENAEEKMVEYEEKLEKEYVMFETEAITEIRTKIPIFLSPGGSNPEALWKEFQSIVRKIAAATNFMAQALREQEKEVKEMEKVYATRENILNNHEQIVNLTVQRDKALATVKKAERKFQEYEQLIADAQKEGLLIGPIKSDMDLIREARKIKRGEYSKLSAEEQKEKLVKKEMEAAAGLGLLFG